ncbi:MAG: PecA family PE domain-processing aspartic protease [Actinomycetota bacterium]
MTALATPAVATGVCLLGAATANAAPDDTSSSASSHDSRAADTSARSTQAQAREARVQARQTRAQERAAERRARADDDDQAIAARQRRHLLASQQSEDTSPAQDASAGDADDAPDTDTVDLALQQIDDAREQLTKVTWDSGNHLAGLAALYPQMLLGGAQANLQRWQDNHERLQQRWAATAGDPLAHMVTGMLIESSIRQPIRAQYAMDAAEKLIPLVGKLGPRDDVAAIAELVGEARDNGLVYQIVRMDLQYNGDNEVRTEPVIYITVNDGEKAAVLVDTGSLGLVIDPRWVGVDGLGSPGEQGEASYGDGSTVTYVHPYQTTVGVGGATSAPTEVLVVDLESVQGFTDYNGDYVGVLGIGPNAGAPGQSNPFTALPGQLSKGALLDERRRRIILGPNPYAAEFAVDGAPNTNLVVKVGDFEKQEVKTIVDSGGILGAIPSYLVGGATEIPVGTQISVYAEDGETLIYTYRTTRKNTPSVSDTDDFYLTGFVPFSQRTMYFDYSGNGTTVFNVK